MKPCAISRINREPSALRLRSRLLPSCGPGDMDQRRTRNHYQAAGGGNSCSSTAENAGILDERILVLVFAAVKWDPHVLCLAACVSRRLRAVAERRLWKELCVSRAPRMVEALTSGGPRVSGGWHTLAKLLFFCCGCQGSQDFRVERPMPGHFVGCSRFSKTSGRSFLARRCWGDLLYVSDPCEHPMGSQQDDVGVYRGVFGAFIRSRTRACLIRRQAQLEPRVRCPYCAARVWSMTAARLVPLSASRRLGSHEGSLEYFVCLNGHLYGSCWLIQLSSDDDGKDEEEEEEDHDEKGGRACGGSGCTPGECSGGGPK